MPRSSRFIHPDTGETLHEIRSRVHSTGRYAEFERYVDQLKESGVKSPDCHWGALAKLEEDRPVPVHQDDKKAVARKADEQLPAPIRPRSGITLHPRDAFKTTTAAPEVVVDWVFNNLCIEDVMPLDAPSPGAWTLLERCRRDEKTLDDFLRLTWPKSLPQKMTSETIHVYEDDARKIVKTTMDVQEIRDESIAEAKDEVE